MDEPIILRGLAASPGVALGPALVYNPSAELYEQPAGPSDNEIRRLDAAIEQTDAAIAVIEANLRAEAKNEEAEIFAAHRMLLGDPTLRDRGVALIFELGSSAAEAINIAGEEQASELESLGDEYLSARATDIRDIVGQIRRALSGAHSLAERLVAPAVVVAADLGPSDLAGAPRDRLLGFALTAGGLTAHSTILARALGIPAIVGLGEELLDRVREDDSLALDGATGQLVINPPADEIERLQRVRLAIAAEQEALRAQVGLPSITSDGQTILLVANASTPEEARAAHAWGAAGVGLLRTELLFLDRPDLPSETEQLALYKAVARELPGTPITVRTLDVGGDKHLPAFPLPAEENPFLGWRGIRIGLSRPDILLPQLHALLRAGAEAEVRIMLPMITTVDELRQARALLEEAQAQLAAEGLAHAEQPALGIMIEVPAAALNAEALAREADFFSIGTNDLTQYTLACDRGNSRVSTLYQPLDPAVLRLIQMTCLAAHRHGRHVAVCGELGGDPQATALLIGLGVDELSCAPSALPRVRAAIRATNSAEARTLAEQALACSSAGDVKALVEAL